MPKLSPFRCLTAFAAAAFQAFGMYNIHALANVTEGGILGLILLFEHWIGLSPAVTSLGLNSLCYLFGWKTLGKEFLGYSLVASLGYALSYGVCELFPPLWPQIANYPALAAIVGAVFVGIGAGVAVRAGGAITGDDALAMSLQACTGIRLETLSLISDLTVLALSLSYIPVKRIAYSLLTVVLSGQIIGWIQKIPGKNAAA